MKLSILIPTLPSRFAFFARLWAILEPQLTDEVEVLWLGDAHNRPLGAKRNELLQMAQSDYVVFCDDDDLIEPHYVSSILEATKEGSDVICFDQTVSIDGGPRKLCKYGLEYEYVDTPELWTGKPAHTQPYKTAIAQQCHFPLTNWGEDFGFVSQAWPLCKTQTRINDVLYHYQMNHATSETRGRKRRR